jgi:hypothetical protein
LFPFRKKREERGKKRMANVCRVGSRFVWIFLVIVFAFSNGGWAESYVVPNDFATITEALQQADVRDEIEVRTGVYVENIVLKPGVRLWSTDPENTVIQAVDTNQPVVSILAPHETVPTVISGFKITGGKIGIKVDVQDPQFQRGTIIRIDRNWITGNDNVGIDVVQAKAGSQPHYIQGNLITLNRNSGIQLAASMCLINNTIADNGFLGDGQDVVGNGVTLSSANAANSRFFNNVVLNNEGWGIQGFGDNFQINNTGFNIFFGNPDGAASWTLTGLDNLYIDPGVEVGSGFDYKLQADSIAQNTGQDSEYNLTLAPLDITFDPAGRILEGQIDRGAFEYNPAPGQTPSPSATPTRTPTMTPTPRPTLSADFNRDGYIDARDLFEFMEQWQSITPTPN